MLHLRPHRRLALLRGLVRTRPVELPALAGLHRRAPVHLRILVLVALADALVSNATTQMTIEFDFTGRCGGRRSRSRLRPRRSRSCVRCRPTLTATCCKTRRARCCAGARRRGRNGRWRSRASRQIGADVVPRPGGGVRPGVRGGQRACLRDAGSRREVSVPRRASRRRAIVLCQVCSATLAATLTLTNRSGKSKRSMLTGSPNNSPVLRWLVFPSPAMHRPAQGALKPAQV